MELTKENYFSPENEKKYMGSTQFKNFVPALGGCEDASMAKIEQTREWLDFEDQNPQNKAFLVGSYLHAWNEGAVEEFKEAHPEIMKKRGSGMLKEFEDIDMEHSGTRSLSLGDDTERQGPRHLLHGCQLGGRCLQPGGA